MRSETRLTVDRVDSWVGNSRKIHTIPVQLDMVTVIGIEGEILDELRDPQAFTRDECITICAYHYELLLGKPRTPSIHER